MDIISVFALLGGLALFLYGMNIMSSGLERIAGGKLESLLRKMTSNPFKALLLGTGITCAIQSSSAVTVMLVGLVNSGIMQLSQTVGVIMGSNIGTTITAWLLSLTGIQGDTIWLRLLKPSSFSPLIAFIGILLFMIGKSDKKKSVGAVCLGFAVLMTGMEFMSDAVKPLAESQAFTSLMTSFSTSPVAPLIGILIGTAVAGIIQSSSASVGILQALSLMNLTVAGTISLGVSFPIILGMNIGTTVTALISSIGTSREAKRVAIIHLLVKCIGGVLFLAGFWIVDAALSPAVFAADATPFSVAIAHTIYNVANTALLLPFQKLLLRAARTIVRDKAVEEKKAEDSVCFIDQRLFSTPSLAVSECNLHCFDMTRCAHNAVLSALSYMDEPNEKKRDEILAFEDKLDRYEDALGKYLVSISALSLSDRDNLQVAKMLHAIGNLERIGDHAVNMIKVADEIEQKSLSFSTAAKAELSTLRNALTDILSLTTAAYIGADVTAAARVEPLEQVIDELIAEIRARHIARLQKGHCTVEMGFVLADLLNNYERISDHCSNLAVSVIEAISKTDAGAHAYLESVKKSYDFNEEFEQFLQKYALDAKHS